MASQHRSIHQPARLVVLGMLTLGLVSASLAQPQGGRGRGFNRTGEAEVPPAVAMPRPDQAELARANELFDQFRNGLGDDDRAMLARYPRMLEVTLPVNTAIVPNLAPFFQQKHQQNLAARSPDTELLLMGDSITDFWRNEEGAYAGKPILDQYFGQWQIANFGIAGDTTQGVLYRLQNGEGEGFSPRAIMLMIGTNNTIRNNAAEIAEGVGAVVLSLERHFPEAEILLLGVFPRGNPGDAVRGTIAEINRIIGRLDDRDAVHYLDIGDVFLEPDGSISTDVMSDRLHPSTEGYRRWAEAVKDPLAELMAR
jgi:lysophospholipase L1-like esterase